MDFCEAAGVPLPVHAVGEVLHVLSGVLLLQATLLLVRNADDHVHLRQRVESETKQPVENRAVRKLPLERLQHLLELTRRHGRRAAVERDDGRNAQAFRELHRRAGEASAGVDVDHVRTKRRHRLEELRRVGTSPLLVQFQAVGRRHRKVRIEIRKEGHVLRRSGTRRLERRRAKHARVVPEGALFLHGVHHDRLGAAPFRRRIASNDMRDLQRLRHR